MSTNNAANHAAAAEIARNQKALDILVKTKMSYNYCAVCGRIPKSKFEEANYGPLKFWDADDGWKIGTLCRWCHCDVFDQQPHPDDYAYRRQLDHPDVLTDEDPMLALLDEDDLIDLYL